MHALLLVDHGSRNAEANLLSETFGLQLAQRTGMRVYVAHMELAEPSIATQFAAAQAEGYDRMWVLPLFFAPGRHMRKDIPALLEAASESTGLAYTLGREMLTDIGFLDYCAQRIQQA